MEYLNDSQHGLSAWAPQPDLGVLLLQGDEVHPAQALDRRVVRGGGDASLLESHGDVHNGPLFGIGVLLKTL